MLNQLSNLNQKLLWPYSLDCKLIDNLAKKLNCEWQCGLWSLCNWCAQASRNETLTQWVWMWIEMIFFPMAHCFSNSACCVFNGCCLDDMLMYLFITFFIRNEYGVYKSDSKYAIIGFQINSPNISNSRW